MHRSRSTLPALLALGVWLLGACGGGDGPPEAGAPAGQDASGPAAGIPVAAPAGPVDEALAERGERLFQEKGCVACHSIGKGRLTGPDLAGVHQRREWPWIYHMVTNPDSMVRDDPTARQLMGEYMTPMPNLGIQPDEVRALYEHIREESAEAEEES